MNHPLPSLHELLISFLDRDSGDSGWSVIAPLANALDDLTPFQKTLLPLAYQRWHQSGRDVESLYVMRGIYRKTWVRNRLFLIECAKTLQDLRAAQIDALVFKGGGLLGRLLPDKGLRAISDIDLWIRPSQFDLALQVLASPDKEPSARNHAVVMQHASGLQLDLHALPSHLYTQRALRKPAAEDLFEQAYRRNDNGNLCTSDLLYYSFLNPLFEHPPGEGRAAFALLELNEVLAGPSVTDGVLREVSQRIKQDQTAAVFLEHHAWLGRGHSPHLDRFFNIAVESVAAAQDWSLVRTLPGQLSKLTAQDETWLNHHVRRRALALRTPIPMAFIAKTLGWSD
jgi:hypothetical protein